MANTKDNSPAVEEYLATLPDEQREALEKLRRLVKRTVPGVNERISYGGVVIFARTKDLVGFVARAKQLSFFTMSPELARAMKDEITPTHRLSGATIHFTPGNRLPDALVEKILTERIREQDKS